MFGIDAIVLIFLISGIIGAVIANHKGRSKLGWFILCGMIPLLIVLVAVLPPTESSGDFKKCPYCAELVKTEAVVCKHCGRDLPEKPSLQDPDEKPAPKPIETLKGIGIIVAVALSMLLIPWMMGKL